MATKQVKKSVTTRTFTTSGASESGQSSFRGRSPSPARISRLQEKDQLTGLNDRLAAYIDHIRSLESENSKLHLQVQTFEETSQREVSNVKALYEKELAAARKLVDEVSKENAQLAVSVGTYKSDSEEWMRKYTKKDRELTAALKKLPDLEARIAELEGLLAAANKEKDRWQNEFGRAKSEIGELERQLSSAKKQLEEETLQKVDLENRVQSLKEELAFKAQLHQSEMNETRTRMEYSMEEVDSRTQRDYENRLQEALTEFREQHEIQTRIHREELESLYEAKIAGLQKELQSQDGMDEKTRIEVSTYKSRISELQSQINKLTNQNAALESRIATLEVDLSSERDQARAHAEYKDKEIRLLRSQIDDQMREYQDLLDIKVSLDLEIAAYRKLIEGEEERLNLSQSFSQQQSHSSVKSTPRKRRRGEDVTDYIQETESCSGFTSAGKSVGCLDVAEVSEDGKYVKVKNNSDKEVSIGGWRLEHKAGAEETDYKFHRSTKLNAGEVVTVWSSDAGETHDAATHNLVMKTQKWVVADSMKTTLVNKDGEEQASCEMTRTTKRTILKGSRQGGTITANSVGNEEIFHQKGDPGKGSCSLM